MKKILALSLVCAGISCVALANEPVVANIDGISTILTSKQQVELASKVSGSGYYKGIRLAGRVQVVNSFPDLRVQVVNSFPDLKVQRVKSFPDKIGQWQFVDSFPDFKIQFVNSFPDIKIQYVNSFPGLP